MKAMLLKAIQPVVEGTDALELANWPDPQPGEGEILVEVIVCGVCHTELDEIEGRALPAQLPMILGHQVVGRVERAGPGVFGFEPGQRVGVAWIYSACGRCPYCLAEHENLCPDFRATGKDVPGGYAEKMVVPAAFAHPLPSNLADDQIAPFLCAGAIGYRSFRLTGRGVTGGTLGLMGFGASGHLVLKLVRAHWPQIDVYVFSRNLAERELARELGACWAGEIDQVPPVLLDAIIDTTPVWHPVVQSLRYLRPGGRLVINAIRKESQDQQALLQLSYPEHLWLEKEVKSVANVTRRDVREFLGLVSQHGIRPVVRRYALDQANEALRDLKFGRTPGAKVLVVREG